MEVKWTCKRVSYCFKFKKTVCVCIIIVWVLLSTQTSFFFWTPILYIYKKGHESRGKSHKPNRTGKGDGIVISLIKKYSLFRVENVYSSFICFYNNIKDDLNEPSYKVSDTDVSFNGILYTRFCWWISEPGFNMSRLVLTEKERWRTTDFGIVLLTLWPTTFSVDFRVRESV